jgi:hypothetical protein
VNSAVEKRIAATPKRERTTFWKISTPTTATMDAAKAMPIIFCGCRFAR